MVPAVGGRRKRYRGPTIISRINERIGWITPLALITLVGVNAAYAVIGGTEKEGAAEAAPEAG